MRVEQFMNGFRITLEHGETLIIEEEDHKLQVQKFETYFEISEVE